MSLVPSLFQAILRVDGQTLVMHVGEKPYVVSASGRVELATRALTADAIHAVAGQLLPADFQRALEESGATQYELPSSPDLPSEHFTVVASATGLMSGSKSADGRWRRIN